MDKFKTVFNIVQKKQTSLGFTLVAFLTAGGEQIFSTVVFQCPCNDWNFAYGMVFLLVPALALLGLGYILSNKTWKMFTGLCIRINNSKSRAKHVCAFGIVLFQITSTALVAPVSWIAVALLNGKFYECAITSMNMTVFNYHLCSGMDNMCQVELQRLPCPTIPQPKYRNEVLSMIRAESQIMGWLLIASMMLSTLLLICVARCKSPVSYKQLKFWKAYSQQESLLMDKFSEEHAKKLAGRNLESFFQQEPPKSLTTPPNEAWRKISNFYRFSTKDQFYSTLHRYVEMGALTGASVRSGGPDIDNPAVLAFIDEGEMGL